MLAHAEGWLSTGSTASLSQGFAATPASELAGAADKPAALKAFAAFSLLSMSAMAPPSSSPQRSHSPKVENEGGCTPAHDRGSDASTLGAHSGAPEMQSSDLLAQLQAVELRFAAAKNYEAAQAASEAAQAIGAARAKLENLEHEEASCAASRDYAGAASAATAAKSAAAVTADVTAEAAQVFDEFDIDYSGGLSSRELRKALKALGLTVTSAQAEAVLKEYDDDGSRHLSAQEFTSLVAKLRAAKEQTNASEAAAAAALPIAETHGYKGNILYDRRRNMVREWAQVW